MATGRPGSLSLLPCREPRPVASRCCSAPQSWGWHQSLPAPLLVLTLMLSSLLQVLTSCRAFLVTARIPTKVSTDAFPHTRTRALTRAHTRTHALPSDGEFTI